MKIKSWDRSKRTRRASTLRRVEQLEGRQLLTTSISEFTIPTDTPRPTDVTTGPDGNLWFTEINGNKIGMMTTSGVVTEYNLPATSSPDYIIKGPDNNLWFTAPGTNTIDRITTSGNVTQFTVPTSNAGLGGITVGPDGNLWFCEQTGDQIGRITTSGVITEYADEGGLNSPYEIVTGSDGNLWFTEINDDEVGKIVPSGPDAGTVTLYATAEGSQPRGIAAGSDGNLWFTEGGTGDIGRITTSGVLTEFSVPNGSGADEIAATPTGDLYFSDGGNNTIGQIDTSGNVINQYAIPTSNSGPDGMTIGPDGNVWFSEFLGDQIGELPLTAPTTLAVSPVTGTYGGTISLTATLTSGGEPVDNEQVDVYGGGVYIGARMTNSDGMITTPPISISGLDVGSYSDTFSVTFPGDSSYLTSSGTADLTVDPAPLTITINNQSKVYGQANPTPTATVNGIVEGDVGDVTANYITLAGQYSNVQNGGYPITFTSLTGTKAEDYSTTVEGASVTPGTLTVTPAPLTVTIDNQSKVYGQPNPTLTGTVTGVLNGDDAGVDLATIATQYSDVIPNNGGYLIYVADVNGTKDEDYSPYVQGATISFGTLTVTPAPLTIAIDNQSKVYGQPNPTPIATVNGIFEGDLDDVTANYTTAAGQYSDVNVDGYPITLASLTGAKAVDYSTTVEDGSESDGILTVTPAPLTIAIDNQSKVYGQPNPTPIATVNGIFEGDLDDVSANYSTLAGQFSDIGDDYPIIFDSLTGTKAEDYSTTVEGASVTPATLIITQAPLQVTIADQSKVYGQAETIFTGTVAGVFNGDDVSAIYTTTAGQYSDVGGDYPLTFLSLTGTKALDYSTTVEDASVAPGTLTITQAPLTITINNLTKVYGQDNPTLTGIVTGVLGDDEVSATYTTTAGRYSDVNVDGYAITLASLTGPEALDYSTTVEDGSETDGILAITQAPVQVVANNATKVYGRVNPNLTANIIGILNDDPVAANLATTASQYSDVNGEGYSISVLGLTGPKAGDYSITSATPSTLTITKAPLVVHVNSQSKVYGQANPNLTGTFYGNVDNDNVNILYATTATRFSNVTPGGYAITVAGIGGTKGFDYSISVPGSSVTPGTLAVTPAPLSVLANSEVKVYGRPNPVLNATLSGVLDGDLVFANLATVATQYTDVKAGGYPITFVGLTGPEAEDYSAASTTPGTLTITQAPLVVTIFNQTRAYGSPNSPGHGTFYGNVNNDNVTPIYGTTATQYSDVKPGGYPITVVAIEGTKGFDYSATVVDASLTPGVLTITPAPIVVTAFGATKLYGAGVPTLAGEIAGMHPGDAITIGYSTTATAASHVKPGGYPITVAGVSGPKALDYAIAATVPASLTVTPAPLTIAANDVSKTYGSAVPSLTANYSGFVNGDSAASLSKPVTLSTTAKATSPFGSYPIVASGAASSDYAIRYEPGTLTVARDPGQEMFVDTLYEMILGRSPEQTGLDGWLEELATGTSESAVAMGIYDSPEAVSDRAKKLVPTISEANAYTLALKAQQSVNAG